MNLQEIVTKRTGKAISQCSNEELYFSLLEMTKGMAEEKVSNEGKRKLYYISAEFLIGKLLSNNLINLGLYDEVKEVLGMDSNVDEKVLRELLKEIKNTGNDEITFEQFKKIMTSFREK